MWQVAEALFAELDTARRGSVSLAELHAHLRHGKGIQIPHCLREGVAGPLQLSPRQPYKGPGVNGASQIRMLPAASVRPTTGRPIDPAHVTPRTPLIKPITATMAGSPRRHRDYSRLLHRPPTLPRPASAPYPVSLLPRAAEWGAVGNVRRPP